MTFLHLRPRATLLPLLASLPLLSLSGCGSASRPMAPAGKDAPPPVAARRQSEFDFYCSLRPPQTESGTRPFAPAVYEAMKARGYKVNLVHYRFERSAGGFGGYSGYGFRNFFGSPGPGEGPGGRTTYRGERSAVVWETRRGESFLVDRYYGSPLWLEGSTWLEKVRFYDPAAVSVEVEKS